MDVDDERIRRALRGRIALVSGASGFIGGRLVEQLRKNGARLRLLSRTALPGDARTNGAEIVQGDVRDPGVWERALPGSDFVFHLAAQTSARASERDPDEDFRVNLEATFRMLDACRRSRQPIGVLLAGSVTQCGAPASLPVDGTEPDVPLSFYDLDKLAAERFLERFARRGDLVGTSLRLTSVYGAGSPERSPDCGVLNGMMRRALRGETLTIYDAGHRLRDFLHVEDAVRAFLMAASSLEECNAAHYVVGSGERRTVAEAVQIVAAEVERARGRGVPVVHIDAPADEPEIAKVGFAADPSRFRAATGWAPRFTLREGIESTLAALTIQSA